MFDLFVFYSKRSPCLSILGCFFCVLVFLLTASRRCAFPLFSFSRRRVSVLVLFLSFVSRDEAANWDSFFSGVRSDDSGTGTCFSYGFDPCDYPIELPKMGPLIHKYSLSVFSFCFQLGAYAEPPSVSLTWRIARSETRTAERKHVTQTNASCPVASAGLVFVARVLVQAELCTRRFNVREHKLIYWYHA